MEIPIFTWRDKKVSFDLPEEDVRMLHELKKTNPEKFYETVALGVKNEYPELFDLPEFDSKSEVGGLWEHWMTLSGDPSAILQMAPPPNLATQFMNDMEKYGLIQGFTWNFGDDLGIQGPTDAYKIFSHIYPGRALMTEVGGSLVSGGVTRKAYQLIRSPQVPKYAKNVYERIVGTVGDMFKQAGLGAAGMMAWRYGAGEEEHGLERAREAALSPDVLFGAGFSGVMPLVAPLVSQAPKAWRGFLENYLPRILGKQKQSTAYNNAVQRVTESWIRNLPRYEKAGVTRQQLIDSLEDALENPLKTPIDAFVYTEQNLARMVSGGISIGTETPLAREAALALRTDPIGASMVYGERLNKLMSQNQRIHDDITAALGNVSQFPRTTLRDSVENLRGQYKPLYAESMGQRIEHNTLRTTVSDPSGQARSGENMNALDLAWDKARSRIEQIRSNAGSRAKFKDEFGRVPEELPTREGFINSNSHLSVQQHQMIEEAMYDLMQTSAEGVVPKMDRTIIQGVIDGWNKTVDDVVPIYGQARRLAREHKLLEDAYEAGRKFNLKEGGDAYNLFEDFIDEATRLSKTANKTTAGGQLLRSDAASISLLSEPTLHEKVKNMFIASALRQVSDDLKPSVILRAENLRRIETLIDNPTAFNRFKSSVQIEEEIERVTRGMQASPLISGKGQTVEEMIAAGPTMLEQLPSTAAMGFFAPMFAAGRKSAEFMRLLRGMENQAVAAEILRGTMTLDDPAARNFIRAMLQREKDIVTQQNLSSSINRIISNVGRTASSPLLFERGPEYRLPKRIPF